LPLHINGIEEAGDAPVGKHPAIEDVDGGIDCWRTSQAFI
jgi:hypothetical protein